MGLMKRFLEEVASDLGKEKDLTHPDVLAEAQRRLDKLVGEGNQWVTHD